MLTRSNPEFSLHTYTHTQSYRTKCDFVLYVFGAWKNEHPDKRVFLRAFFLIQIFPHTQQAVLEHQHTNTCEHSRRTHTHSQSYTLTHVCAFFGGLSKLALPDCTACLLGLLGWTSSENSLTLACPWKLACVNFDCLENAPPLDFFVPPEQKSFSPESAPSSRFQSSPLLLLQEPPWQE